MKKKVEDVVALEFIWLTMCCGPQSRQAFKIYSKFGNIHSAYMAEDYSEFKLPAVTLAKLRDKSFTDANEIKKKCDAMNIRIVTFESEEYPLKLRKIKNPPLVLYFKGIPMDFDKRIAIGIVGTRKCSVAARQSTEYLAGYYGSIETIVVSGLAKGVDSIAQRAAFNAGGKVVAVLGTAIDKIYPVENAPLYNKLYKKGLVISEYWPGCPTNAACFPQRNRIIAGLSDNILVIEAPKGSGALITANLALEQNKKVYIAPMPLTPENAGAQLLVNTGLATVIGDPLDVFDGYELDLNDLPEAHYHSSVDYSEEMAQQAMTMAEKREVVYDFLVEELDRHGPETIDEIVNKSEKYTLRELLRGITQLQIDGIIIKVAGGRYETLPDEHNTEPKRSQ